MKKHGFTLIELLIVISVIGLLLALLVPALSRARRQARAVACQANLKQWGLHFTTLASEEGGRLPEWAGVMQSNFTSKGTQGNCNWLTWGNWVVPDSLAHATTQKMRLCPMARTPRTDVLDMDDWRGGTFLAWGRFLSPLIDPGLAKSGLANHGSYGLNFWSTPSSINMAPTHPEEAWRTADVRGAGYVPFMLDSALDFTGIRAEEAPPGQDAIPVSVAPRDHSACINRHRAGVNTLLLDWSVRKVGLKELWTLKWHREYDTAGPWTKAGGARPEDWPAWMRGFRDY